MSAVQHNSWHKYTNFELGVRVPLIMRAPMLSSSVGAVVNGLAELVDVYPTIAELAGTAAPTDHLDGVSLVPFMTQPTLLSFPTSVLQGTLNKTVSFSQYPHSDGGSLVPATSCTFFHDGGCHDTPATSTSGRGNGEGSSSVGSVGDVAGKPAWMGFSMRDQTYRYTAWLPYNQTTQRADWNASPQSPTQPHGKLEEMYDHSSDDGTDFNAMDVLNLAGVNATARSDQE